MVDYGTMCSNSTLVVPSHPEPLAQDEEEVTQDTASEIIARGAGGTAPVDLYTTSSDQINPDQIIFEHLDIDSLDYLLDLPSGSGHA